MHKYLDLLEMVYQLGDVKTNKRTEKQVSTIYGKTMVFDMYDGFPIITTKKIHFKSVVVELLWFLTGETNIDYLHDHNITIWDEWADEDGELGPVYGKQWTSWRTENGYINQIQNLINSLKSNPTDRGHIVSAWNVGELNRMALRPCHCFFQCHVNSKNQLILEIYQRSCDIFLGVPFNISSYALLLNLIALYTNLEPYQLIWHGGDVHLYHDHLEQVKEQVHRKPMLLPQLKIKKADSIFSHTWEDFELVNYKSWPALPGKVAI